MKLAGLLSSHTEMHSEEGAQELLVTLVSMEKRNRADPVFRLAGLQVCLAKCDFVSRAAVQSGQIDQFKSTANIKDPPVPLYWLMPPSVASRRVLAGLFVF